MEAYAEDPSVHSPDEVRSCAARDGGREPLRSPVSSGPRIMSRHRIFKLFRSHDSLFRLQRPALD